MPQRVANFSTTVHRKDANGNMSRVEVKAGQTFNFTKEEIDDLTRIDPNAVRKVVNESLPEEAENDGSVKRSEGESADTIDTTTPKAAVTEKEKVKQTKASDKAKTAEENASDEEKL